MFTKKTTLILGAGASVPYGYPTGAALISEIIKNIGTDQVNIPSGCLESSNFLRDVKVLIDRVDDTRPPGYVNELVNENKETIPISSHIFEDIDIFKKLKQALIKLHPVSIDSFLSQNPSHMDAGKIMIVYSLLKHEDTERLQYGNHDNWYRYLLHDLISGLKTPEDFRKNKLKIITFNYDMSLDYYIFEKMKEIEFFQNSQIAENPFDVVDLRHVYGFLYDRSNLEHYGKYADKFKNRQERLQKNTIRFCKAYSEYNNIRLMYDSSENEGRITNNEKVELQNIINIHNDETIAIGFSFDQDNLNTLGFSSSSNQWRDQVLNSSRQSECLFKYMDFEGKANGVASRLKSIYGDRLIRSVADKISDAYQNDFKL